MTDEIRKQVEQIKREWDEMAKEHEKTSKVFDSLIKSVDYLRNEQIAGITVADAVERIRLELLKDKEPGSYYYAWQCNLAMCFYDEIRQSYKDNDAPMDPILEQNLHRYSTNAAKRFIEILCLTNGNNTGLIKQYESQASR